MTYNSIKHQKINPIEPPCKKTMYDSVEQAMDSIVNINETMGIKLNWYNCTICKKIHLTTKF